MSGWNSPRWMRTESKYETTPSAVMSFWFDAGMSWPSGSMAATSPRPSSHTETDSFVPASRGSACSAATASCGVAIVVVVGGSVELLVADVEGGDGAVVVGFGSVVDGARPAAPGLVAPASTDAGHVGDRSGSRFGGGGKVAAELADLADDRRGRQRREDDGAGLRSRDQPRPVERVQARQHVQARQDALGERPEKDRQREHEVQQRLRDERRGERRVGRALDAAMDEVDLHEVARPSRDDRVHSDAGEVGADHGPAPDPGGAA